MVDTLKWDHPEGVESKGSILLVHGTSTMDLDGNMPNCGPEYPLGSMSLYKRLSEILTNGGWSTLHYTRRGVSKDSVDSDEYMKVDHDAIVDQLKRLFNLMPNDKPRIILCWSGGSLHIPHLPLEEVQGAIIVGGLCTNRFHNAQLKTEDLNLWKESCQEFEEFENMTYEEMLKINRLNGSDGPLLRFWQELRLKDNWTYFRKYINLPMLILHGLKDPEVPPTQARLWKQLLPYHNITVVEKPNGNHFCGNDKENGAEVVGAEVLK